jgi:hypothetical protein
MSTENKGSGNSAEPMIWVDMEMSGLKPDSDRISRDRHDCDRRPPQYHCHRASMGGSSSG